MGVSIPVHLQSIEAYIRQKHGSARHMSLLEIQTLDAWATGIVTEIEQRWPVDTSTSRDAFMFTIMHGGDVGFTIENDCDYVEFIHEKGTSPEDLCIDTIIPEVINENSQGMLSAMRDAVDATEEAARGRR